MAESLMRVSVLRTFKVFLGSYKNSIRAFASTTSQSPTPPPAEVSKTRKRRKKKNLLEVASFLPNWGIGYQMAKTHWKGFSYEITKINLYKDGRHGKAWGVLYKDGVSSGLLPKKISGVHKRCWKYIAGSKASEETKPEATEIGA